MEYAKLVSVTGMTGLFELISTRTDGAVVKSLDDSKSQFISSRLNNFSQLESIEVFTTGENVNLVEVFYAIEKATNELPDVKDNKAVKKYFETIFSKMDFEKVYPSDMKKMIKWFHALKKHNVEIKLTETPQEEISEAKEEIESPKKKK